MPFQITETTTGVEINDATPSTTTAYSGQKIEDEIALLVTAADAPQLPQTSTAERVVVTTADENVFEDSLKIYRESGNTINIGEHDEPNRSTREESICIGLNSGANGNATHQKTCVGYQAGRGTSGDELVAMGVRAFNSSTGQRVTALGHYAMAQLNNGNDTTCVGHYAGQYGTALIDSVAIGSNAGRDLTGAGAERCVFIGSESGRASLGNDNTLVGREAGKNMQGGYCNGFGRYALLGNQASSCIAIGNNCLGSSFGGTANTQNNKFCVGDNLSPATVTKPYILDCDMGATDSVRTIRLNADSIHVGSSMPTSYDAANPLKIWVSDNTLRRGPYSVSGPTESYGNFSKNSNNIFFNDSIIRLQWYGNDQMRIRQLGLTAITDVYATAHVFTNNPVFVGANPMPVTTTEKIFTRETSAHFVDFTIASRSNPSFPYYKIHFEVMSSTGSHLLYWNVKKYV